MQGEQLAERIGMLPPESRALVEKLVNVLAAKGAGPAPEQRKHFLDIRCVRDSDRATDDVVRQVRDERDSWQDR